MTDIIDRAQAAEQRFRDRALSRRVPRYQTGSDICEDCGKEIPPERRRVLPSATRCITCETLKEKNYGMG